MPMPILTINDFCAICSKMPQMGVNKPHSQHKTKRVVRPNLGKWEGLQVCAKCRKTLSKPDRIRKVNAPLADATVEATA